VRQLARSGRGDNEIVGAVLAAFGVLYGLLLSLIAAAAYENLNTVEAEAANEASAILALHRDVSEFPSPLKERLQAELGDYCQMISDRGLGATLPQSGVRGSAGRVPVGPQSHAGRRGCCAACDAPRGTVTDG
jgi:hypothetical protein